MNEGWIIFVIIAGLFLGLSGTLGPVFGRLSACSAAVGIGFLVASWITDYEYLFTITWAKICALAIIVIVVLRMLMWIMFSK